MRLGERLNVERATAPDVLDAAVQPLTSDEHVVILRGGARIPLTRGVRELQDRLRFT